MDRIGIADDAALYGAAKRHVLPRKADHRAIDQLDRDRTELDDVLCRIHGSIEPREMTDAEHAVLRQR